jgi:hypothetical protein
MKHAKSSKAKCALAAAMLFTVSACGQPEPPRTVSDFCLAAKRLSAEPAPIAGMDDPGNLFDTEQTFAEVIEHNAVWDRLCSAKVAAGR